MSEAPFEHVNSADQLVSVDDDVIMIIQNWQIRLLPLSWHVVGLCES